MDLWSLLIGTALGAIVSWAITDKYFKRSTSDMRTHIGRLSDELKGTATLEYFEHLLTRNVWRRDVINHRETWIAQANNTFQIQVQDDKKPFQESWTAGFPDPKSFSYSVHLCINDVVVKKLTFVSMDGGRILVPRPEVIWVEDKPIYFWNPDSLHFKVGRIVGSFYIFEDIIGIAERCGIEINKEARFQREPVN